MTYEINFKGNAPGFFKKLFGNENKINQTISKQASTSNNVGTFKIF